MRLGGITILPPHDFVGRLPVAGVATYWPLPLSYGRLGLLLELACVPDAIGRGPDRAALLVGGPVRDAR